MTAIRVSLLQKDGLRKGGVELIDSWQRDGDDKLWVDIQDPEREVLEPLLEERFGFHELAAEDCLSPNTLPKYDPFPNYDFFVFRAVDVNLNVHGSQTYKVAAFLGCNFLFTVHRERMAPVDDVCNRLPNDVRLLTNGPDFLLYSIVDQMVDAHFPLLDRIEESVAHPSHLDELLHLKRDVNILRRQSMPQRELLNQISRGDAQFIQKQHLIYFRDLYDHMFRISETIDVERDMMAGTMEAYLSVIANRGDKPDVSPPLVRCTAFHFRGDANALGSGCDRGFEESVRAGGSRNEHLVHRNRVKSGRGHLSGQCSTERQRTANNSATATTTVSITTLPDLVVTKTDAPDPVAAGSNITYTITVTNIGTASAASVSLTDAVPANTTFASFAAPTGWVPSSPGVGGTGTVTATNTLVAPGAAATFTLVVTVNGAVPAGITITNTASVATPTPESSTANNSAPSTTTVGGTSADLSISKTPNVAAVALSGQITYTITVTNGGPATANSVMVSDTLPGGTTFVSAAPSQGSCTGTATVVCSLGSLSSGSSATITLVVTAPATPASVVNTATVSGTTGDPNSANNSASTIVLVVANVPALGPLLLVLLALALATVGLFARPS